MSPFLAFLLSEIVRITLERLNNSGKLQNLTEAEAKQIIADYTEQLDTDLPSPDDLVGQ